MKKTKKIRFRTRNLTHGRMNSARCATEKAVKLCLWNAIIEKCKSIRNIEMSDHARRVVDCIIAFSIYWIIFFVLFSDHLKKLF